MSQCQLITAKQLKSLCDKGAISIIDVREPEEYAHEHIATAENIPLSCFSGEKISHCVNKENVVFLCQSGMRTQQAQARFSELGLKNTYILQGGLNAWKSEGHCLNPGKSAPLPIMRQVQIIAGSLVVLGVVLSWLFSPLFMLLAGFVGCGLIFAGITGFCGMANLLLLLPYNRND